MWECVWKKSDVTLFVIVNIFISNCNLITIFFLVTVTNYNYFYFVIKLRNFVTCNLCYITPQHWQYRIQHQIHESVTPLLCKHMKMQKPLKDILVKN